MFQAHRVFKTLVVVAVLAAVIAPGAAAQGLETLVVTTTADGADVNPSDAICDADPGPAQTCTLRAAIQTANVMPGKQFIDVNVVTYRLTLAGEDDTGAAGDLDVTGPIRFVWGQIEGHMTIDASSASDRALDFRSPSGQAYETTLEFINVTGGRGVRYGGGIRVGNGVSLNYMRGTISNNSALHSGGGIYSTGTLRTEQAYIQNNRTTERATDNGGGGVFGTQVTLRTTVLRDNSSASQGGGLYVNAPSTLTVNGTSITGNYAQLDGGGVFYRGPMLSLSNATLSGNEAQLDVSQQQFGRGGGLHLAGVGQWAITEATVVSNRGFGGGLSVVDSGPGWMQNTIMANNFAVNCTFGTAALIPGGTGNLIDDRSCQLSDAANLIDVEPWLGPLSYDKSVTGYHLPLPGSLALDALGAIPGTGCLSPVDQRGWDRPIDANNDGVARCDIGAVERQGFDPSATPTPARPTPIATPKPGSTLTSTPNPPIPPVPTFVTE